MEEAINFTSTIEESTNKLWGAHFAVPDAIAKIFSGGEDRRVVCNFMDAEEFQCALMPVGEGRLVITVNKKLRDKFGLKPGSKVRASIRKDESEYGLPVPEEFAELLKQDEEGSRLLHALTPGKLRTLLYIVAKPKNADARISAGIAILEHLKKQGGKIDYKVLNLDLKAARG